MSEREAKLLAAELQYHRYWEVTDVFTLPPPDPDGWRVRLRRRNSLHVFLHVCKLTDELPDQLVEWGQSQ